MRALLAGYGGIGANVYYPELQKLGYEIDILDQITENATFRNVHDISESYDLAIISTPNFTHKSIAESLALSGTQKIFVEKPGLENSLAWWELCTKFKDTRFHVVKNNLYREDYGQVLTMFKSEEVIGIDICWINDNRIPNPGSWFTNKNMAFGGVSRDLMPHMYCFLSKILGEYTTGMIKFNQSSSQRWSLENIHSTDYGKINPNGIFNVDDTAIAMGSIDNISIKLYAAWKEGYDKQSITLYFKDGTVYEWDFGLCPADAYGRMLQDDADSLNMDLKIHSFLEQF